VWLVFFPYLFVAGPQTPGAPFFLPQGPGPGQGPGRELGPWPFGFGALALALRFALVRCPLAFAFGLVCYRLGAETKFSGLIGSPGALSGGDESTKFRVTL